MRTCINSLVERYLPVAVRGSSGGTSDDDSSDADADGDDSDEDTALQATTASADYDATPAVVEGLSNVKYVAAGSAHSVAVAEETLADGTTVTKYMLGVTTQRVNLV